MALAICSLNSGSNGNCYYIANNNEAVLIDAGLSCRETEKRMKRKGLSFDIVKAVFISHEHTDHIRGLEGIAKKHKIPVYITPNTYRNSRLQIDESQIKAFSAYQPVSIGALAVTAFPKFHDAADPHSFIIAYKDKKIGVLTDIGACCEHVIDNFQQCDAVFLEANYDENLLESGRYPYFLKNRIRGGQGHLSNAQALKLFIDYRSRKLTHVLLSHLSKDNNCPDMALQLFNQHAAETKVVIASRFEETEVFMIEEAMVYQQLQINF
jgi:phosphoribosyl 1,2-cyclic phosphodiesterase